jgi:hypothetical protein
MGGLAHQLENLYDKTLVYKMVTPGGAVCQMDWRLWGNCLPFGDFIRNWTYFQACLTSHADLRTQTAERVK